MRVLVASLVFIALLAALGFYAVAKVPAKIQGSIKTDIEYQFQQNDIQHIEVAVSGRDVTLQGKATSQEQLDSAINIASHRPGVRIVMIETIVDDIPRAVVAPLPDEFEALPEAGLETE
jgi:hypothetical protein